MSAPAPATALVTGAASGIGRALALRIAAPGRRLLLHTRGNVDGLERVAVVARDAGAEVETATGDLGDEGVAASLVERAEAAFGGLDWLISNAGFADKRRLRELPPDGLAASHLPIAAAFFGLVRAASPLLEASPRGRVVAVSSFVAHRFPFDGNLFPASAAAKAALEALARAAAAELAPAGVTVNVVAPGYTRKDEGTHAAVSPEGWQRITSRIPLGRLAVPDDVAATIAFLLSDDAAYLTGQTIHVDGGLGL